MQYTEWVKIRNAIRRDTCYIFICENIQYDISRVTVNASIFGIIRNRVPHKGEKIRFHILNDAIVGFDRWNG